jgi:hypothetical protein
MNTGEDKTIESIKLWQLMMHDIHPVVEKELIKLALVLFVDAKSCQIDVKLPEIVAIHLKPYSGVKRLYNRYIKRYNKKHSESAKKLIQYTYFWLPADKTGIKPKIEVFFE